MYLLLPIPPTHPHFRPVLGPGEADGALLSGLRHTDFAAHEIKFADMALAIRAAEEELGTAEIVGIRAG
ncbi:unnamed protein product, partial [Mesorhabditis spiculigera]